MNRKHSLLAAAVLAALQLSNGALAQPQSGAEEAPRTPTPRLADGTVDLGGNGVWNLPYITNFAARMPGYKEGDLPPFQPWARAMWEYNRDNLVKYDPEGFCL